MGLQILQEIRDQLKQCRAVSSDREFCEQWLGKSECYMRTLKYGELTPSADALMTCASKLCWYAGELANSTQSHHVHWAEVFERLCERCVNTVELQAQHNWQSRSKGSAAQ